MHYWSGRPRRDGRDADEWKPDDETEVAANIDKWYAAGRPLFPRDSLQQVRDQLSKPLVNDDAIYIKGFDEVTYDWPVRIGDTHETYAPEDEIIGEDRYITYTENARKIEWKMIKPCISYKSFDSVKSQLQWSMSRAYCAIYISHPMLRGDEKSEILGDVDAGHDSLNTALHNWELCEAWAEIKSTLLALTLHTKLSKIVGMACGSFTEERQLPGPKRSLVQNAFLLSLKWLLQESDLGTAEVPCFAQDPGYWATDRAVLERSGINLVDDPEGFLQMDENSLVFSCSPNICVKEIIADSARPLIMILDTIRKGDPETLSTDPNSPRVQAMVETDYEGFPFPTNHDRSFCEMTIYVKKQALAKPPTS